MRTIEQNCSTSTGWRYWIILKSRHSRNLVSAENEFFQENIFGAHVQQFQVTHINTVLYRANWMFNHIGWLFFSNNGAFYKSRDIKIIFPIMSNLIFLLDKSKMSNIKFYVCNKRVSDIYMCLKCKGILIKPFRYVQIFQTVPDFGRFHDGKLKLYWLFTGHS